MGKKLIALFCVSLLILSTSVLALDAPIVSSPSHPDPNGWSKGNIVMEWNAVEDATGYYFVNDQNPETEPSIEDEFTDSISTRFNIGRDGVYYFHVRAIGEASLGPVSHYKFQVDITRPQWDERDILNATANSEGNIEISWTEPVDNASGVDYYRIHRDRFFDFAFRSATKKYAPAYGTSYEDTNNMEENSTFFYLLVAIDKAGNQSTISNRATATTGAFCNLDISFNADLSEDKQTLLVSITSDGNIYGATLVATLPDGVEHEFFSEMNNFPEYSGELDLNAVNEGVIELDFDARERLGDDCSQDQQFIYDVTNPTAKIISPELNETISEEVTVTVTAFDNGAYNSGVSSVEFFVRTEDWESIGEMTAGDNNVYSLDWNTFNFGNGRHQLKAVAKDYADNTVEASGGAILLNTLYQEGDANSAISQAKTARIAAIDFINSLKKRNIISDTLLARLAEADSNLSRAEGFYDEGGNSYTDSRQFAVKATGLFESIEGILVLEETGSFEFDYNPEQVPILLNASLLDKALVQDAIITIAAASPQRTLKLVKVLDGNTTIFRANMVVRFNFPLQFILDNNVESANIIEFVPKEFTPTASDIFSFYEFEVMQADPIIKFTIDKNTISSGEISYGLNKDLTQEEADALTANNVVNKYPTPPVFLSGSSAALPTGFVIPGFDLGGLGSLQDLAIIAVGVVVVIIIIAIALFVFLSYRKKKPSKKRDLSIFK
jgi:hypothetical protein